MCCHANPGFLGIVRRSQDRVVHVGVDRVNHHPGVRSGTCLYGTNPSPGTLPRLGRLAGHLDSLAAETAWIGKNIDCSGVVHPRQRHVAGALGLHAVPGSPWLAGRGDHAQAISQHLRQSRAAKSFCNAYHARLAGTHLSVRPASVAVGNHDPGVVVVRVRADAFQLALGRNIYAKRVCSVPACLS